MLLSERALASYATSSHQALYWILMPAAVWISFAFFSSSHLPISVRPLRSCHLPLSVTTSKLSFADFRVTTSELYAAAGGHSDGETLSMT